MTFEQLSLVKPLLEAVKEAGYTEPSPIQEHTIPLVLGGHDVLGCAQTGTGKTAAFALPILQNLDDTQPKRSGAIRALILTPTRELAIQIHDNFKSYGCHMMLRVAVIFGGVGQNPQVDSLRRGVDILVATPGRLNDLIGQGILKLDALEVFVLDEADRMLDMGFIHDVRKVIKELPADRQTLLFSATMPKEIEELAGTILKNPKSVKVDPVSSTVDAIDQSLYYVDKGNKRHLLAKLLKEEGVGSALVFVRTKHGADRLARDLNRLGVEALAIHGNKSQSARQDALNRFKQGDVKVLIATDIAARGIDISELSHVFNYDLPDVPETYVHRIGRTGRAGLSGIAVSFCCFDELDELKQIEKLLGRKLPEKTSEWPMVILEKSEKQPRPSRPEKAEKQEPPKKEQKQNGERQAPKEKQPKKERPGKERPKEAVPAENQGWRPFEGIGPSNKKKEQPAKAAPEKKPAAEPQQQKSVRKQTQPQTEPHAKQAPLPDAPSLEGAKRSRRRGRGKGKEGSLTADLPKVELVRLPRRMEPGDPTQPRAVPDKSTWRPFIARHHHTEEPAEE